MKQFVLDANTILDFLENGHGADKVAQLFRDASKQEQPLLILTAPLIARPAFRGLASATRLRSRSQMLEFSPMSKLRARKIKLIIFDVDGVLTDGKIWIFPAPGGPERPASSANSTLLERATQPSGQSGFGLHSATLIEAKGFHAHDGTAISLARLGGIKTGVITKRISETVALRARDLKLDHVYQGIQNKAASLHEILKKDGITAAEVAFVGDDIIDLPVMRLCGLAIAVKNARPEVKAQAHYITAHAGGDGAARDAVEFILKAQGTWKKAVSEYIAERGT